MRLFKHRHEPDRVPSEPEWAELVCTIDGVIAESKTPMKSGQVVNHDTFQFCEGYTPPKPGDRMLCPRNPDHYLYFRIKRTGEPVRVGGYLFHTRLNPDKKP